MSISEFTTQMNTWGQQRVPFLFVVDFEMKKPLLVKLQDVDPAQMLYSVNGFTNAAPVEDESSGSFDLHPQPETIGTYRERFNYVAERLSYGDSFLTNLTIKTPVTMSRSLRDLFYVSNARYRLWKKDEFLVFSPEIFVQLRDGKIFSFPMKGTIDASIPGAADLIMNNIKEKAEHTTIVDLIRNDLSQVAANIQVKRFRYLEEIRTSHKNLLQVSSEIVGELNDDYHSQIGNILVALLPAGSVSGAPKPKTLDVIREAEGEQRGYYTGIFGYYDGHQLDSGVMIRFIEQSHGKYFYRSGGGITTQSVLEAEYQEAIDKIYVPVD